MNSERALAEELKSMRQQFQQGVEVLAATIVARHAYFDSIFFWTARKLPQDVFEKVRANCRQILFDPIHEYSPLRLPVQFAVHGPNKAAIEELDRFTKAGNRCLISRADLAFDFVVRSAEQANELQEFLAKHICIRWASPKATVYRVHDTVYIGRRSSRVTLAIYSDRPGKKYGDQHCCHFELRLSHAIQLRRNGIDSFARLLIVDPMMLVSRRLKLATYAYAPIGRQRLKRPLPRALIFRGRRLHSDRWSQAGYLHLRALFGPRDHAAHHVLSVCRELRVASTSFTCIPATNLLGGSLAILW